MRKVLSVIFVVIMLMLVITPTDVLQVCAQNQVLFINEIMAANDQTIRDGDIDDKKDGNNGGAYSDWIEIYNSSDQPIDLTGYTISDSGATWVFPQCTIQARGYLLVWASDKDKVARDGQLHTNFKLSASGEEVILKAPNGNVVDYVNYESLLDDQSYGRRTDGSSEFVIFTKSTPSYSNSMGTALVNEPVFSKDGGFYTQAFDLEITTNEPRTQIYYTMDGSDPEPGKSGTYQYTGRIEIKSRAGEANVLSMISNISTDFSNQWRAPKGEVFKCTTVKAVAIRDDGSRSKVITHSYFVDPNIKTRYTLPVISVVTDYDNLFDPSVGIYYGSNAEKRGKEWERPAHVEFFEPGGKLGFSQNIGLRIHGNYTRKFPQKSFRLYADGENGDLGEFKYEIFPDLTKKGNGKKMKTFERLILRQSGNDWSSTYMRDAMMQSLVSHINILDTQAARPAVLFLNGEYWGVYYIRERYDKEYLSEHYNLDEDRVAIIEPKSQQNGGGFNFGFDPNQNWNGGFDPNQNWNGGFDPNQNWNGGFDPNQNWNGGFDPNQNWNGGFDPNQNWNGGFNPNPNWGGGADPAQVISVEEGTQEDADAYTNEVINYLKSNSITQKSTYEYIKTKIDIDNYIVYNIAEIFFGNTDWPGNNVSIWRYKTDDGQYHPEAPYGQDGRWRWFLKDVDFGFGLYNKPVNHDTLSYAAGDRREGTSNPEWSTFLFRTLLQNTEFRNQFINTFADHLNTTFVPERVIEVINYFENILSPEMLEHTERWQYIKMAASNPREGSWSQNVQVLKDYARNRPANMIQFIRNKFSSDGVTGTANITLNTDPTKGYIKINTIDIKASTPGVNNPSRWTGLYFTGIPVTVTAIPEDGYVFDHWEGIAGNSETLTFTHTGELNLTAVFRRSTDVVPTPTITPTPTRPDYPGGYILGDVNWDGRFDSLDFGLVRMYLLGMKEEYEINVAAADVNADGKVDAIDFANIRLKLLGFIDKFPAE